MRFFSLMCVMLIVLVLFPLPCHARSLTIDDVLDLRKLQDVSISPSGADVVYVVQEPHDDAHSKDPTNTELKIVPTRGGESRRLTSNPGRDSLPRWSPNGKSIAFLSDRPGHSGSQIHVVSPSGGNVRQLSHHPTPIRTFAWSPSGNRVAFLATAQISPDIQEQRRRGDDEIVLDSFDTDVNAPLQRLWILNIPSCDIHQVDIGNWHVTQVSWSPDATHFLLATTDDANLDHELTRTSLSVVAVTGGKPRKYCSTRGKINQPRWLPDGGGISFLGASANGTEQSPSSLFVCRGMGNRPVKFMGEQLFSVQTYHWLPDGKSVLFTMIDRNTRYLATFDQPTGKVKKLTQRHQILSGPLSLSSDGQFIACTMEEAHHPSDLWAGNVNGSLTRLTHLNPEMEEIEYGETEEFDWTARDGWDITGILIKPIGYQNGKHYPLIVHVHGGPESADLNGFQIHPEQLLATNGYAVLLPNYRGSIGRGVHYTIANHGDRGGGDFRDIMDGVDALIQRGIADPNRLGIAGWSYGGFMTSWAVTQTDRFKAAMIGMGITNWYSLMSMCPVPIWNAEAHFLQWHYDNPAAYWQFSPVLQVKNVRTPTLLLYGERDPFIPPAQGRAFFRGLRYYGVTSEMVVYPREGHGLRERLHRKDAMQRELAWFEKHVKQH